ncbi:unnamed protein product [Rhizoctonia solani]|uniref:Uncharacterized protein n=1 Tax=Rhizoctonia solani TaxID=456999 RepID=A0A8H3C8W8_9AGAM|nr:unnamed protein product [Rhizoctonia solani]
MTAQVIIYPQPTNSMSWTTPSTNMSQDDYQQHPFSNGAYSWSTHMSYSSLPEHSASYDGPSYSGTYGHNHATESDQHTAAHYSHDLPGAVGGEPASLSWVDIPLDPNAIYHMPVHGSGWPGTVNSESPYERDREVIRQAWEQRIRDNWLRRNGINALPTDTQYDRFIPELRAGEYAERYFGRPEVQLGGSGRQSEEMRVSYQTTQPMSHSSISPTVIDGYPARVDSSHYDANTSDLGNHLSRELQPPANYQLVAENRFAISPLTTSGQVPAPQLLQLPYRDPPTPLSPTDASSPSNLHPNTYVPQHSNNSPATAFSPLDSEGADSPLSEIRETRSTSPAGSAPATYAAIEDPPTSRSAAKTDSTERSPMITRSRSLEGATIGQSGMGPVRRGNSTSERGVHISTLSQVYNVEPVREEDLIWSGIFELFT